MPLPAFTLLRPAMRRAKRTKRTKRMKGLEVVSFLRGGVLISNIQQGCTSSNPHIISYMSAETCYRCSFKAKKFSVSSKRANIENLRNSCGL